MGLRTGSSDQFELEEYSFESDDGPDVDSFRIRNTTTGRIVGDYDDIDSAMSALEGFREDVAMQWLSMGHDEGQ